MIDNLKKYFSLSIGFGIISFVLSYGILSLTNLVFSLPSILGYAIAVFCVPMILMLFSSKKMSNEGYWSTYKYFWAGMCFLYLLGNIRPALMLIESYAEKVQFKQDTVVRYDQEPSGSAHSFVSNQPNIEVAKVSFNKGLHYQRNKQYSLAIKTYEEGLRRYQSATLYNNIGACYLYLNDYQSAIEHFDKAKELDKTNSIPFYNRGLAYFLDGAHCLARNSFMSAQERKPTVPETVYMDGIARLNHVLSEFRINNDPKGWRDYEDEAICNYFRTAYNFGVEKAKSLPASSQLGCNLKPFTDLTFAQERELNYYATRPAVYKELNSQELFYIDE
jgi:tetratricopeptide (TPR) repeat protein